MDSPKLTKRLQKAFSDAGFEIVEAATSADVVYQFDGEYIVNPENDREGIVERVGAFSEHPHVIAEPVKKPSMVKNVIGGFFTAMSGVQVYRAATDSFNQLALIVANRNFNGKDTRVSVTSRGDAAQLV